MPPKKSGRKNKRSSASAATTTATGDKHNENSKPDDQLPVVGGEQGGNGDEHAAKTTTAVLEGSDSRAAAALENDAFEKISKMLTLTLADEEANEGGEREAGQGEGARKVIGGVEVGMGRRHHGSFFYDSGGGGKVRMEWRLVREGDTEREVSASALRSQPVSSLSASSSSFSSSSSPSSSFSSPGLPQPSTPGPWRLQLKFRLVRRKEKGNIKEEGEKQDDEGKRQDEEEKENEGDFVPYPLPGSSKEKRLIQKRERKARKAHMKKAHELEEAIKNNRIEQEKLTDDETTSQEDLMLVSRELQFLKAQLREHKAPEAEARYELSGKDLLFELKLGDRVVLEGLPGRPSVVWSADAGAARSHESEWRSSRSLLMADGNANV